MALVSRDPAAYRTGAALRGRRPHVSRDPADYRRDGARMGLPGWRRIAVTVGLLVLLGGGLAARALLREQTGGPVSGGGIGLGAPMVVGRPITVIEVGLRNGGDDAARVTSIRPVEVGPHAVVRVYALRPGTSSGNNEGLMVFPPNHLRLGRDFQPLDGARVPAHGELRLVVTITPTAPGCTGTADLDVRYREGLRHYRRRAPLSIRGFAHRGRLPDREQTRQERSCQDPGYV